MTVETIKPSATQSSLLLEIHKRCIALEESQPPKRFHWHAYVNWQSQRDNGPLYSASGWFGRIEPSERQRLYRALRALEEASLVEAVRVIELRSRPKTFLKLTPAGAKLAGELLNAK